MPVSILHVATRHRVGGAERNLRHTLGAEVERGFSVHVAVGTEDLILDFPPAVQVHEVSDLHRELSPIRDARAFRRLHGVIRKHDFDIVHTHQSKAGALGRSAALASRGRLIVHTVHMASFGPGYSRRQDLVFRRTERMLAPFTDCCVFVGQELMQRYVSARAARPDRSRVIRSPIVNLAALVATRSEGLADRQRHRDALRLPSDRPVVLAIGALDGRKRHALILQSLAPLLAAGECTLVLAGSGPERARLERLRAKLGVAASVVMLGFVGDVSPLYATADVLVQTSTMEGVPQTVVQAIAAGVPVVATEVDGLREVAPGRPHLTVLPIDGHGLASTVRATLRAGRPEPIPAAQLAEWLPRRVDECLGAFHDWLEAGVRRQRAR